MRTGIPPALREIVEQDAYLARLQTSLSMRVSYLEKHGMGNAAYVTGSVRARIVEMRSTYRQGINEAARDVPIVYSATGVRGIGTLTFLRLAIYIDIGACDTPASLWRYCGQGVTGGMADPLASVTWPGIVRHSSKARRALGPIRTALLYKRSRYRPLYDTYKARSMGDGVSQARAHLRASRYTLKVWLKHLWSVWRRLEGLPLGVPHPDDETWLTSPYGWR